MKLVTFIFESIRDLKNFEQQITTSNFEIELKNLILILSSNEKEIAFAETTFPASVLK